MASEKNDQRIPNRIIDSIRTLSDSEKYSFCEKCNVAKLSNRSIFDFADVIRDEVETQARNARNSNEKVDWLRAWNSLDWAGSGVNDTNNEFLDVNLDSGELLHGVDRKFLYSFWRDCFDNRQQLFLIFVRAEPTSVGGGGIGRVSSQLGGRAVALVWRDPVAPNTGTTRPPHSSVTMTERNKTTCPPHRTRVLFYHQFD